MSAVAGGEARQEQYACVSDYLARIARTPLLTAGQEVELARRIEAGVYAAHLIGQGSRRGGLEEVAADGRAAREQLIVANLRLVVSIAKRYAHHGVPLADLIQDGNLGLIEAVERFDHARGNRFSTCATWWIRKAILCGLEHAQPVRLPPRVRDRLRDLARAEAAATHRLGRPPTERELAAEAGARSARYVPLRRFLQQFTSLDAPIGQGRQQSMPGELVRDEQSRSTETLVEQRALRNVVTTLVGGLTRRHARVLRLRYGLDGGGVRRPREVADQVGLPPRQVSVLEQQALTRLRQDGVRHGLRAWTR